MRTDERGETLLEVIVAVAIMAVVIVAFAGGLVTITLMSDVHRKQAAAGAHVRDWAEAIETSLVPANFTSCGSRPNYEAVGPALTGYTKKVANWRCWPGTTDVQQLTLEVASADKRATESLVVFVRKPCTASPC